MHCLSGIENDIAIDPNPGRQPQLSVIVSEDATQNCDDKFEETIATSADSQSPNSMKISNNELDIQKLSDTQKETRFENIDPPTTAESSSIRSEQEIKTKSKHKTEFQAEWTSKYPWICYEIIDGKDLLFCKLCCKHLIAHKTFKNSAWITKGFATIRLDKIKEHEASKMHSSAIETEVLCSNLDDKQNEHFEETSPVFKAIKCAMKCLNFLIQHNIPHTTVFKPLIDFLIDELDVPVLKPIKKAKNATYTSYDSVNEILDSMAKVKREEIFQSLNNSPSFSIMIDETTDVSNRKHLAVVAKYVQDGKPTVSFLKDTQIPNGTADVLFSELQSTVEKFGGFQKMTGFGSDGASAMVGIHDGVAAKVKRENDAIISIHCLNHRLALATKDSFESEKMMVKLDSTLTNIYKYYKSSSLRSSSLAEVQNIFSKSKGTTLKRVGFTRWLSHENAINSVQKNIHPIIIDLENAIVNGNGTGSGPTAADLLKEIKSFKFYRLIHFMCDVLAIVSKLTVTLEKRDVDISIVEEKIGSTLEALKKLKGKPGGLHCRNIEQNARKIGIIAPLGDTDHTFKSKARNFIDMLIEKISNRLENISIITFLSTLSLKEISNDNSNFYGNVEIIELANFYKLDEDTLLSEWEDFKGIFFQEEIQNKLGLSYLCEAIHKLGSEVGERFSLIRRLLSIANTLPLSTAEVERVFSQVSLIVTDHRNRLKI